MRGPRIFLAVFALVALAAQAFLSWITIHDFITPNNNMVGGALWLFIMAAMAGFDYLATQRIFSWVPGARKQTAAIVFAMLAIFSTFWIFEVSRVKLLGDSTAVSSTVVTDVQVAVRQGKGAVIQKINERLAALGKETARLDAAIAAEQTGTINAETEAYLKSKGWDKFHFTGKQNTDQGTNPNSKLLQNIVAEEKGKIAVEEHQLNADMGKVTDIDKTLAEAQTSFTYDSYNSFMKKVGESVESLRLLEVKYGVPPTKGLKTQSLFVIASKSFFQDFDLASFIILLLSICTTAVPPIVLASAASLIRIREGEDQKVIAALRQQIAELEGTVGEFQDQADAAERASEELQEQLRQSEYRTEGILEASNVLQEKLKEKDRQIQQTAEEHAGEILLLQQQIARTSQVQQASLLLVDEAEVKVVEAQRLQREAEKKAAEALALLDQSAASKEAQQEITNLHQQIAELSAGKEQQLLQSEAAVEEVQGQIVALQEQIQNKEGEHQKSVQDLEERIQTLEAEFQTGNQQISTLKEQLQAKATEVLLLKANSSALQKQLVEHGVPLPEQFAASQGTQPSV